jgi:hypothetical protein
MKETTSFLKFKRSLRNIKKLLAVPNAFLGATAQLEKTQDGILQSLKSQW